MISAFFHLDEKTIARHKVMFIPRAGDYIDFDSGIYIVTKVTRRYNEEGEVSTYIDLKIDKLKSKS